MKPPPFPSEPPTISNSMQARSARLVACWAACLPAQRLTIERLAEKLAALPRRKLTR